MLYFRHLLTYHIQMSLKDQGRFMGTRRRGLLFDDHVIVIVLNHKKASLFGKVHAEITHGLTVVRAMRNLCQDFKIFKYFFWF